MRKSILSFFLLFVVSFVFAQQLTQETSLPRTGDKLYKVQLSYTTSGASGREVFWDFSQPKEIGSSNYQVGYSGKIDSVLCLTELRTQYRYQLSSDSLLFIGYENAALRITNTIPEVSLRYPFSYGDSIKSYFYGEGSYSHIITLSSYGLATTVADGLGSLKLPDMDTLHQVIRVRHDRYIGHTFHTEKPTNIHHSACSPDTIQAWLDRSPVTWHVTHCQWYATGYRYPIFETFENSIYQSGTLNKHFNTAFYYPPSEQKYLKNDPANYALREQLAIASEKKSDQSDQKAKKQTFPGSGPHTGLLQYMLSPDKQLTLTYQASEPVELELILTTVSGIVLYRQASGTLSTKQIDLSRCVDNEFILCVIINGRQESVKIIDR